MNVLTTISYRKDHEHKQRDHALRTFNLDHVIHVEWGTNEVAFYTVSYALPWFTNNKEAMEKLKEYYGLDS